MRDKCAISIGLVVLLFLMLPGTLRADDFTFSFTNGCGLVCGTVAGTVAGEVLGLTNNTTGPATDVIITSFPAGLTSNIGPAPISTAAAPFTILANSFTEVGGAVTDASYHSSDLLNGDQLGINYTNESFLSLDTLSGPVLINSLGFGAVVFTPIPTPEPSSISLMLLGIGLAFVMRKRLAPAF
jgi:hypothetical protein